MHLYYIKLIFLVCFLLPSPVVPAKVSHNGIIHQKEHIVYITKTGEKYHRETCRYLSKSKIKISYKDALKNGYAACKVCKP